MNILVVDDNKSVRDNLFTLLTGLGYFVDCAVNGLDALAKIKNNHFHFCVVDHLMPLMNGVQLTKNLKDDNQYKNIPVLLMTTEGCDSLKFLPDYSSFYAVLNKPINTIELLRLTAQVNSHISPSVVVAFNE